MAGDPPGRAPLSPHRVAVIGGGLVGTRAAAWLARRGLDVVVAGRTTMPRLPAPVTTSVETIHGVDADVGPVDAVVLATESMHQVELADRFVEAGTPTVTTADRPEAVRALWGLATRARRRGVPLVVGAAYAPGLSTLLAAQLAEGLQRVDAITTARFGTGGPACAREHHRSMAAAAWEVRAGDGRWVRGGSGRMLVWFPDPAGPQDCYRAGLAEPFLLQKVFPQVARVQSLQAATRRDRLTARLPMMRRPHAEGLIGAVWAEVRGQNADGSIEHRVMAATAPQASGAAAVAAAVTEAMVAEGSDPERWGMVGWTTTPAPLLAALGGGIHLWAYDGELVAEPGPNAPLQAARKWRGTRENTGNVPTDTASVT